MIDYLTGKYRLPPFEDLKSKELTAQEIIEKIRDFHARWEKSGYDDLAPLDFLELLNYYPISICKRDMSDILKTLITLAYFDSKLNNREHKDDWKGYSYEDLSLRFCRSKASIHEAIKEKERVIESLLQADQPKQANKRSSSMWEREGITKNIIETA